MDINNKEEELKTSIEEFLEALHNLPKKDKDILFNNLKKMEETEKND